jgi:hypothetical protein
MMFARISDDEVDEMTDAAIVKSGLYNIDTVPVTLAVKAPGPLHFEPNRTYTIEYIAALIPSKVRVEQITRLADVRELGGHLLGSGEDAIFVDAGRQLMEAADCNKK